MSWLKDALCVFYCVHPAAISFPVSVSKSLKCHWKALGTYVRFNTQLFGCQKIIYVNHIFFPPVLLS